MNQPFEPIVVELAYQKVAAALIERITAGAISDGERLPSELALAKQFGVNRSTVREALRELQSVGLLTRMRGSKLMVVTRPQTNHVAENVSRALVLQDVTFFDVWESMSMFEPSIAEAAARRRTASDLALMRDVVARFELHKHDAAHCVHHVAEFFGAIGAATRNPVLVMAQEPLIQLLEPSLGRMIDHVTQARSRIVTAHRRLTDAIAARNADDARAWMVKHIRDFRRGYEVAGIDLHVKVTV